jgi:hypothetical protein
MTPADSGDLRATKTKVRRQMTGEEMQRRADGDSHENAAASARDSAMTTSDDRERRRRRTVSSDLHRK